MHGLPYSVEELFFANSISFSQIDDYRSGKLSMDEIYYRTHHYRVSVVLFHIIKMIPGATFRLARTQSYFQIRINKRMEKNE